MLVLEQRRSALTGSVPQVLARSGPTEGPSPGRRPTCPASGRRRRVGNGTGVRAPAAAREPWERRTRPGAGSARCSAGGRGAPVLLRPPDGLSAPAAPAGPAQEGPGGGVCMISAVSGEGESGCLLMVFKFPQVVAKVLVESHSKSNSHRLEGKW